MKNPLFQKCALLALIGALLLIPLSMIERTIEERTARRAEAIRSIAASSAGEQSIAGPVLTIPVVEEYDDEQVEEINGERRKKTIRRKRTHTLTVLPRVMPMAFSAAARRAARARTVAQFMRRAPWITAGRSAKTSALRSTKLVGLKATWLAGFLSRCWS